LNRPFDPRDFDYVPPGEPVADGAAWCNRHDAPAQKPRFELVPDDQIVLSATSEWLVKKLVPKCGVGIFYGASMTLKSFVAIDLNRHVAIGWNWAGRAVSQAPTIYIAAEGAAGVRKRKIGFDLHHDQHLPQTVPFFLIEAAPNLGTGNADLLELIRAVESARVTPGMITIDTLSKTLGGGEENGAGMLQIMANAEALSAHFRCFVLIVHHSGFADEDRPRGHSSLIPALDLAVKFERKDKELLTVMTVQKMKDEDDAGLAFEARLAPIVIGRDVDGDEISTLIVDSIRKAEPAAPGKPVKSVPRSQRLLMTIIIEAIAESGQSFRPFADGPLVQGVDAEIVRDRLYAKIAEKTDPGDDPVRAANKKRKAFNRSLEAEIKAKTLLSAELNQSRILWLP
jgi:hypothetical protein